MSLFLSRVFAPLVLLLYSESLLLTHVFMAFLYRYLSQGCTTIREEKCFPAAWFVLVAERVYRLMGWVLIVLTARPQVTEVLMYSVISIFLHVSLCVWPFFVICEPFWRVRTRVGIPPEFVSTQNVNYVILFGRGVYVNVIRNHSVFGVLSLRSSL